MKARIIAYTVVGILGVLWILLSLWAWVIPADAQTDSVDVHLEIDPDGDGFYQIQHSYRERAGVWGFNTTGHERVMYEVAPDTFVTIWYEISYRGVDQADSNAFVDLFLWNEFSALYGAPVTVYDDGTKRFESVGSVWWVQPKKQP